MISVNNPIPLDPELILDRIGYGGVENPSQRIVSLVDDYIENYNDFIAPSYAYTYRRIENITRDTVDVGDSLRLKSSVLSRLLARCSTIAVFAVTIGSYLEDMVAQLSEDGMIVQATVLDAIGSGSVEKLAVIFGDGMRETARKSGLVTSRRFSPGYCDWDVSDQQALFRALGEDTAGIELTKSMLMTPGKSVSGVIGIGLPDRGIEEYNPCTTCKEKDCPGRRR